jgi:hypothetical protein
MQDQPKEPYEAPEIQRVKLVKDELAVTGCKTTTSAGRSGACLGRGMIGACRGNGS